MNELELYQQIILDHNRHPRHFQVPEKFTHDAEGFNPLCGDHIHVYAECDNDRLHKIHFTGESCAICKASASIMSEQLSGVSLAVFEDKYQNFRQLLRGEDAAVAELGDLKVFSGVARFPTRIKCAVLAWHALKAALNNQKKISTEEAKDL